MSKIIPLIKSCWHKVICALCALAVIFISVFSSVPAHAVSSDWESLGEDVADLYNAYVDYFNGWSEKSIGKVIGSAVDVPLSWLKTLADGSKVISPVDDWYFYLDDDTSGGGGGRVHSGSSGGSGSDRPSSEVEPEVPSSFLKDVYADYASRYMPMPTVDSYRWSYQDCKGIKSTSPDYFGFFDFYPLAPIYTYTQGQWGDKGWSSVYMLCYVYDDDVGFYYSKQYVHIYPSTSDDGSPLFNLDYYKLSDNTLTYSYTVPWRTDRLYYALSNESSVSAYSNAMDYLGNSSPLYLYSLSDSSPYVDFAQLYTGSVYSISQYVYSTSFDPVNNTADDCGFMLSSKPFELVLNQTSIDFDRVPDNYVVTIEGDTIYNYPITNPDTGDTSTINYYITNNYTLPENSTDDPADNGGSSGGSTSGNVNVSGEVVVGGQIDINADPIDINVNTQPIDINVNVSSGVNSDVNGESVDISGYLDNLPEQSETMNDYFSVFFSFVPPEFLALLISGISIAILMRVLGR
ncbi:MAG: hypothetical protein J6A19_08225 [Oscillospiraceae bacterium]|nr:hypothetical protein [Oscillospiraceae bacterium]